MAQDIRLLDVAELPVDVSLLAEQQMTTQPAAAAAA
jgi:hypothetical protein